MCKLISLMKTLDIIFTSSFEMSHIINLISFFLRHEVILGSFSGFFVSWSIQYIEEWLAVDKWLAAFVWKIAVRQTFWVRIENTVQSGELGLELGVELFKMMDFVIKLEWTSVEVEMTHKFLIFGICWVRMFWLSIWKAAWGGVSFLLWLSGGFIWSFFHDASILCYLVELIIQATDVLDLVANFFLWLALWLLNKLLYLFQWKFINIWGVFEVFSSLLVH